MMLSFLYWCLRWAAGLAAGRQQPPSWPWTSPAQPGPQWDGVQAGRLAEQTAEPSCPHWEGLEVQLAHGRPCCSVFPVVLPLVWPRNICPMRGLAKASLCLANCGLVALHRSGGSSCLVVPERDSRGRLCQAASCGRRLAGPWQSSHKQMAVNCLSTACSVPRPTGWAGWRGRWGGASVVSGVSCQTSLSPPTSRRVKNDLASYTHYTRWRCSSLTLTSIRRFLTKNKWIALIEAPSKWYNLIRQKFLLITHFKD